jgi:cytochrome d ubiquinol oxidase subunit II
MDNTLANILIAAATILLPFLWYSLDKVMNWLPRVLVGAQLFLILAAFYAVYFPSILILDNGRSYDLMIHKAPDVTLAYLGWALIIGSFIIFPSLYYLFKVFKLQKNIE